MTTSKTKTVSKTTPTSNEKICPDCGNPALDSPQTARCYSCFRARCRENSKRYRQTTRREKLAGNAKLRTRGSRVCNICERVLPIAAFSWRLCRNHTDEKLNKSCDRCLQRAYEYRGCGVIDIRFWRRRACSTNYSAVSVLRKQTGLRTALSDLDYVCTPEYLAAIFAESSVCHYCGVQLHADNLHVEHAIPLSRGGRHTAENLVLCCRDCNFLKHTRTAEEFYAFLREYKDRLVKVIEQRDKQPAG